MGRAKILVADDIKQNVKLLRVILTALEYDVIEAYDGEEALEKVKTENPDLILLDIMMPKLTGFEVCQKLRTDGTTKNIPVVMITALHEMDDRIKGIEAGADDFISKPFNKVELLAKVKSLLRMRQVIIQKEDTALLDTILSDLTEGVIVTDGEWKIKNMNQTARELLNIHETDNKNKDLLKYLSRKKLSLPLETVMNTREKKTIFHVFHTNTQPTLSASAKMIKIFDQQGNIVNITLILMKEK